MHLSGYDETEEDLSSISFGSWDTAKYAAGLDFTYLHAQAIQGSWAMHMSTFTVGNTSREGSNMAVFGSDVMANHIPPEAFATLKRVICEKVKCIPDDGVIMFKCGHDEQNTLPDIAFTFGNSRFPISPQHYIYKCSNRCIVLMAEGNNGSQYVLGIPFMRAYYMLFDADNYQIGLARSVHYPVHIPTPTPTPSSPPTSWSTWYLVVGIVLLLGLVALAIVIIYFKFLKTREFEPPEPFQPLLRA